MPVITLDRLTDVFDNVTMMNEELRYTGSKIGGVLFEQGRRQDWLASKVGVTPATVNRWIRGNRSLDHTNASRVADALGVPFYLIFNEPIGSFLQPEGRKVEAA